MPSVYKVLHGQTFHKLYLSTVCAQETNAGCSMICFTMIWLMVTSAERPNTPFHYWTLVFTLFHFFVSSVEPFPSRPSSICISHLICVVWHCDFQFWFSFLSNMASNSTAKTVQEQTSTWVCSCVLHFRQYPACRNQIIFFYRGQMLMIAKGFHEHWVSSSYSMNVNVWCEAKFSKPGHARTHARAHLYKLFFCLLLLLLQIKTSIKESLEEEVVNYNFKSSFFDIFVSNNGPLPFYLLVEEGRSAHCQ